MTGQSAPRSPHASAMARSFSLAGCESKKRIHSPCGVLKGLRFGLVQRDMASLYHLAALVMETHMRCRSHKVDRSTSAEERIASAAACYNAAMASDEATSSC
jgi:hypothetical protein